MIELSYDEMGEWSLNLHGFFMVPLAADGEFFLPTAAAAAADEEQGRPCTKVPPRVESSCLSSVVPYPHLLF